MWCSECQQDIDPQGSAASGALRCGQCGQALAADVESTAAAAGTSCRPELRSGESPISSPLLEADWTIEAELRGLERLVASLKAAGLAESTPAIHPPHPVPRPWQSVTPVQSAEDRSPAAAPLADPAQAKGNFAGWLLLALGLATFACGSVLLGWSVLGEREDLWSVGMPLALLGQAGLIFGFILQLDTLWHTSRRAAQSLHELDGELKNVRQATLLSTHHSPPGQSFYSHLAQGAAPHLLLADLKGQLDLLARQMTQRR